MVILIAEDNVAIRLGLQTLLKAEHDVIACADGEEALRHLEGTSIDLVITDYQMPKVDGLELIKKGKAISPSTAFLMMTAHASVEHAVKAIQMGADDYITKPFDVTEVTHRLKRIEELRSIKIERAIRTEANQDGKAIIGDSPIMVEARQFAKAAATATSPVLLTGPSGSGKKLLARTIHESGPRSIFPFITLDCSLSDESSLEMDLFGSDRVEATGTAAKGGRLEMASRGTIVLDEISALTPKLQAKLVAALESGTFQRGGGSRAIRFNARLISITRRPLEELVAKGKFREDLFFRLKVLGFTLTPLSARPDDVRPLIKYYWSKLASEIKFTLSLSPETKKMLEDYPYPGNVRELQNVLERLAVIENNRGGIVGPDRLPIEFQEGTARDMGEKGLSEQLEASELSILKSALERSGGNEESAAQSLKISTEEFRTRLRVLREKTSKSVRIRAAA